MPEGKFSVGNVEIVGLTDIDVDFPMPLTQLFPNVPLAAWATSACSTPRGACTSVGA